MRNISDNFGARGNILLQSGLGGAKAAILEQPQPAYTEAALKKRVEGEVMLNVVFESSGKIGPIEIVKGLPEGLTEQAVKAAKAIRFQPAVYQGEKIGVWATLVYPFRLEAGK